MKTEEVQYYFVYAEQSSISAGCLLWKRGLVVQEKITMPVTSAQLSLRSYFSFKTRSLRIQSLRFLFFFLTNRHEPKSSLTWLAT